MPRGSRSAEMVNDALHSVLLFPVSGIIRSLKIWKVYLKRGDYGPSKLMTHIGESRYLKKKKRWRPFSCSKSQCLPSTGLCGPLINEALKCNRAGSGTCAKLG